MSQARALRWVLYKTVLGGTDAYPGSYEGCVTRTFTFKGTLRRTQHRTLETIKNRRLQRRSNAILTIGPSRSLVLGFKPAVLDLLWQYSSIPLILDSLYH